MNLPAIGVLNLKAKRNHQGNYNYNIFFTKKKRIEGLFWRPMTSFETKRILVIKKDTRLITIIFL